MFPTGIEPALTASEADALSTELREQKRQKKYTTGVKFSQDALSSYPLNITSPFEILNPDHTQNTHKNYYF
jgi:hypothetical protein